MTLHIRSRQHALALAMICWLTACADPDTDDKTPRDMGADLSAHDMSPDLRDAPDSAPDADMSADRCAGVECGMGGRCVLVSDAASCECPQGSVADGLRCVPAPAAPSLDNLPALESGQVSAPDSFQLVASDANGDALTFSLTTTCAFPVNVDAAGLVSWTCPAAAACEAAITATDPGGLTDAGTLSIACVNGLPAFSSTPPTAAAEGQELRYAIACADPDGAPVTLSVAPDDTCGGALEGDTYVLTPDETQGGAACLLRVLCSDGETAEAQSSMIAVAERNDPPALTNLPASVEVQRRLMGAFTAAATDADLPAQPLTFSATTTCSFPVSIDPASGAISFTCGMSSGTCEAAISVTDGQDTATSALAITCTNTAPTATDAAISPDPIPAAGTPLTCSYTFADVDGDADQSSVEWLVNGTSVATTDAPFSSYQPGDSIACRVTPHDGDLSGAPATSPTLLVPAPPSIAAGRDHTCAIHNGALHCWGRNWRGQLGVPDNNEPYLAPSIALASGVTAVAAGDEHTCAIHNGALECWGSNLYGQLGVALRSGSNTPTPAPQTVFASDVTALSAGGQYTCAIHQGALKCWGSNQHGQLGAALNSGTTVATSTPQTVFASDVTALSAGRDHTCAIHQGALKCWGSNSYGQLGSLLHNASSTPTPAPQTVFAADVTAISAGSAYTCAIHQSALKCWGQNTEGQLGVVTSNGNASTWPTPKLVIATGVSAVEAGDEHTCALHNGALECWGSNFYGQLGVNTNYDTLTPTFAPQPVFPSGVTAFVAGDKHTCALHNGDLKCWGDNSTNQLNAPQRHVNPSPVTVLTSAPDALAAGLDHTCAIHQGALTCWGQSRHAQLGATILGNSSSYSYTASPQTVFAADTAAVTAGDDHTCAIHQGALKCWGRNQYGQLGPNAAGTNPDPTPVEVFASGVTALAAGDAHTCAIHQGALKCWGHNLYGQLGVALNNGSNTPTPAPQTIFASDVTALAAGDAHTCAVHQGALKCWGANRYGQLGAALNNGTSTPTPAPQTVFASDVTAAAAGNAHTCAIHQGALKCWGRNTAGALGSGASGSTITPRTVFAAGVTAVSAGSDHTCATHQGALKCWGANQSGQLGVGDISSSSFTPQTIFAAGSTLHTAGEYHTCAAHGGELKCWGNNQYGQLGYPFTYPAPHTITLP
jgi:alpha-tubulin suppressor-like RCC1 family protein